MERREIFNKILDQDFTEDFVNNTINTDTYYVFAYELITFLEQNYYSDMTEAGCIACDFVYWLEENDILSVIHVGLDSSTMRKNAMLAKRVYDK